VSERGQSLATALMSGSWDDALTEALEMCGVGWQVTYSLQVTTLPVKRYFS